MTRINEDSRRRFVRVFSGLGLGGTLLPGVLWAQVQQEGAQRVTQPMLANALALSGLTFSEEDQRTMLQAANQNLTRYEELRRVNIPNDVAPPFYFSPLTPGMKVNRIRAPFSTMRVKRPANLEEVAFWPIMQLSQLIRTRQVTSVDLTQMYLARLHRHNEKLNCVVTFLGHDAGQAGGHRDQRGEIPRTVARDSLGGERYHRGEGVQDHVGIRRLQRADDRRRCECG